MANRKDDIGVWSNGLEGCRPSSAYGCTIPQNMRDLQRRNHPGEEPLKRECDIARNSEKGPNARDLNLMQDARVTLMCANGQIRGHCDGFVTQDRANWRKTSGLEKIRNELTDSWQRDLADFVSVSKTAI
jgi:hypothetical protein